MRHRIYWIDSNKEKIALLEAAKLGIPIVSILDTNCDPDLVTYPIPGNDDAIRAIQLYATSVAEACLEGRARSGPGGEGEFIEIDDDVPAAPAAADEAEAPAEEVAAAAEEVAEEAPAEDTAARALRPHRRSRVHREDPAGDARWRPVRSHSR